MIQGDLLLLVPVAEGLTGRVWRRAFFALDDERLYYFAAANIDRGRPTRVLDLRRRSFTVSPVEADGSGGDTAYTFSVEVSQARRRKGLGELLAARTSISRGALVCFAWAATYASRRAAAAEPSLRGALAAALLLCVACRAAKAALWVTEEAVSLTLAAPTRASAEEWRCALARDCSLHNIDGVVVRCYAQADESGDDGDETPPDDEADEDRDDACESSRHAARLIVRATRAEILAALGSHLKVSVRALPHRLGGGAVSVHTAVHTAVHHTGKGPAAKGLLTLELSAPAMQPGIDLCLTGTFVATPLAEDGGDDVELELSIGRVGDWSFVVSSEGAGRWSPTALNEVARRAARGMLLSLRDAAKASRCARHNGAGLLDGIEPPAAARGANSDSDSSDGEDAAVNTRAPSSWAAALRAAVPTAPPEMWGSVSPRLFSVRGANYLNDRHKIRASIDAFELAALDVFLHPAAKPTGGDDRHGFHVAASPSNRVQVATADPAEAKFTLIICLLVPGPPAYTMAMYFTARNAAALRGEAPLGKLANPFLFGNDDAFRDSRFKLIPKLVDSNFLVKHAVGSKPAILGRKLRQRYFHGQDYMEVDVDIVSSNVAAGVLRVCGGFAKQIVVDLAFVLEGRRPDELPEPLLGSIRVSHIDVSKGVPLPPPR